MKREFKAGHMEQTLLEAVKREDEFFDRHQCSNEKEARLTGQASPAHQAWVRAVEREYILMGKEVRVHLDTPIARKVFILGFNAAVKGGYIIENCK